MGILRIILVVSVVLLIRAEENSTTHIDKQKGTYIGLESKLSDSLLRRKRSYNGYCTNEDTRFTSDGGGNTVYLDRQHPDCHGNGMRKFRLQRNGRGNEVKYEFSCCSLPSGFSSRTTTRSTSYDEDGGGNVIFLDRHHVSCPGNSFLQSFHLNRNSAHNRYRYTYSCHNPYSSSGTSCYRDSTNGNSLGYWRDWRRGRLIYLDRHLVDCPIGYFLNEFQLVHPAHRTINYRYRCCTYN
ncbi:unnamed protein product [Mytilus coruscus]|uniref:Uncharacterized protein n=1 Tax=Mytilus coruscus TaxID=42192 RepID=A0A6J8BGF4_MYTCO|nr:unnamed protein product [Mytilus coruscus]